MVWRSGRGAVEHVRLRRGGVRLGQAVALRSDILRHVRVRLGWVSYGGRGVTRSVMASRVKTVGARSGLDGYGESGLGEIR